MANQLNTLRFPLHGERLIEASAGTGKTYTIAGLYLRLLLGHGPVIEEGDEAGQPSAHERPLSVTEILVVTFTEAATAELRGRIRARIHEARLAFLRGASQDPLLAQLLVEVEDHALAARRLLAAERQMDEAAVFTIHGFCQRMLKQNAFESGALFETEFLTDDSQLRLQAVSDYWRAEFYPVNEAMAYAVREQWASPAALLRDMSGWLDNTELEIRPPLGDETLAERHREAMSRIEVIKQGWLDQIDEIRRQTEGQISRYTGKNYEGWLAKITDWAQDPETGYGLPDPLGRFGQATLEDNLKKGGQLPTLPLFAQIDELLDRCPGIRDLILQRAARVVRERMLLSKRQAHQLSFDDLLKDLDGALGSNLGDRLCERIRATYRVAMIDEFQDTDPQQYRIFHRLYGAQHGAGEQDGRGTALLMIGDPKQAIYGFRGADIFTYIQARRNVSAHYTLGRNYRSSGALVAAVNGLFERARDPFIYEADIPFLPVEAKGKEKSLMIEGEAAPVLHCWQIKGQPTFNRGDYQSLMARATAAEIHRLLSLAREEQALIGDKPIKAGDIAVLVRTGAEGRLVQQELARLAIASVYLSNRESVLAQVEAREILLVLHACQNPSEERSLRAALATGLFDLDARALDTLASDERAWESAVQEFMEYRKVWHRRGVLAMLRALLHRRNLASSLLASPYGERRLTNFLHLGELLQQASSELDGEYALLRWLGEAISRPNGQVAEQVLRLESERKLVQIVTIHKSKGLEYPLVFLPFICSHRAAETPLFHEVEGEQTRSVLDLTGAEESLAEADKERLAEDLRLLYVALTRGVYATWLGLAPVRAGAGKSEQTDLHHTAIGYLLQKGEAGDAATLATALHDLAQALPGVAVGEPSLRRPAPLPPEQEQLGEPQVRRFVGQLERDWWISSYSGLAAQGSGHSISHSKGVLANPGFDVEVVTEAAAAVTEEEATQPSIFTFPKGARPGTLLHSLFETIDFPSAGGDALVSHIASLLARDGFDENWAPVLQQQVEAVLDTELVPDLGEPLRLRQLTDRHKQVELEFFLPMGRVTAPALTALCQRHDPLSALNKPLSFSTVQGMLKGFIDLVFEWQGRWYLLDYKSNHLGMSPADYGQPALASAMVEHRYDLQYQLYSLALHRLLRLRLPGYDFDQHFGGVFYLFLRGMPEGGVFHTRPSRELVLGLDQLFGEGAVPAASDVSNEVEA